jgi:hypothetical protein
LLNAIDPFRQSLLRAIFGGEVTGQTAGISTICCRHRFYPMSW